MKILSVRQPWAWMLVNGFAGKTIENRDWETRYRGPVLIHASRTFEDDALDWIRARLEPGEDVGLPVKASDYQRGGIIGVVNLTRIVTYRDEEVQENRWFVGDYGWVFDGHMTLPLISCRGQLGLWDASGEIVKQVRNALKGNRVA